MTISVLPRVINIYNRASLNPLNLGKLEVDIDPLSERHVVMDRNNGTVFYIGKNDVNVHYLPAKYAVDSNLIVMILDDTRDYNVAVADGVKCEPVNLAIV